MPCEWLHECSAGAAAAAMSDAVGPAYRYAQGGQYTTVAEWGEDGLLLQPVFHLHIGRAELTERLTPF